MKQITVEMIDALETLRQLVGTVEAESYLPEFCYEAAKAVKILDEAGAFAEVDKAVADEELSMTLLMMQHRDRD